MLSMEVLLVMSPQDVGNNHMAFGAAHHQVTVPSLHTTPKIGRDWYGYKKVKLRLAAALIYQFMNASSQFTTQYQAVTLLTLSSSVYPAS